MKFVLILALLAFTFSSDIVVGGWKKRSVEENDFYIDMAFKHANAEYQKNNKGEGGDYVERLTVFSQLVNGNRYKLTFIDPTSGFLAIQEYIVSMPLNSSKNSNDSNKNQNLTVTISDHKEYEATGGLIDYNEPIFTTIENKLYNHLKDTKEKLKYISFAYAVDNYETNFIMVNAFTEDGQHLYIICQDKNTGKYDSFHKVK